MKEIIICTVIAFTIAAIAGSCIFIRVVEDKAGAHKPAPCCEEELPPLSPFDLISEEE
jgi:hypothetical protein